MSVKFSPDYRLLAVGSDDKVVKIMDVTSYQEVACFDSIHWGIYQYCYQKYSEQLNKIDRVNCIDFSPDGRYLATGSNDMCVKILDIGQRSVS